MLLKLPKQIPMQSAVAFSGLIAVAQIVEGTTPFLAVACFTFLVFAVAAFNVSGGMVYASGAYVAASTMLSVGLGIFVKVVLGEPMQRNLLVPERSMTVYVVGMGAMLAACYVNRLLRPRRALLDGMAVYGNATRIGIACIVVGAGVPLLLPDELASTFRQGNSFLVMAILLPVFETVKASGGRRSFNWASFIAWGYMTALGLLSFSKEAMFLGSVAWGVAAVAAGYRASLPKILVVGAAGAFGLAILTPYSQVGRNFGRNLPPAVAAARAIDLLSHPLDLRDDYNKQSLEEIQGESSYHMFDKPEGLMDRLNMFSVDDALIQDTDKGDKASPANLWSYFTNLVPRYLYPNKPFLHWGNIYALPLGLVGEGDETTGISFSPFADGYHTAQWTGVSLYSFGIFLFGFFLMDSIGGSADHSIWALLYVLSMFHQAPEGMLNAPIYVGATFSVFVIGVALICSKIVPIITNLVTAPSGSPLRRLDVDDGRVESV